MNSKKKKKKVNKLSKKQLKKILDKTSFYTPLTYFEGLNLEEVNKRLKRMKDGIYSDSKDPNSYSQFKTDFRNGNRIKTKQSKYTQQWNKYFPNAKSLSLKSKLTGVPYQILKKVYDKGLAAWRTGHRPGATPQQWGYARVHSFLVKGKTFYTTDSYLAQKAIKNSEKAKKWYDSIEGLCDFKDLKNNWCKKYCTKYKCKK